MNRQHLIEKKEIFLLKLIIKIIFSLMIIANVQDNKFVIILVVIMNFC